MSRSKQQGTAWERDAKTVLEAAGWTVTRLAEGGIHDLGDLHAIDINGRPWVVECKWRERLQPHQALRVARVKTAELEVATALWWKRTVQKPGNTRRSADGEPSVVVLGVDDWLYPNA